MKETIMLILILLAVVIAGCSSDAPVLEDPEPQTMPISKQCQAGGNETIEKCCLDDCYEYCARNNYRYNKHYANKVTCACWCGQK